MKASIRWPLGIGLIIAVHIAAMVGLVAVATGDPSHYVEEDYYERALRWDEHMAQERKNAALGWRAAVAIADPVPGRATLTVRLTDRHAEPVAGAEVRVVTFAVARAGRRLRARLAEAGAGRYAARLPIARPGRWEVRLTVTRRGERFTHVAIVERPRLAPAQRSER